MPLTLPQQSSGGPHLSVLTNSLLLALVFVCIFAGYYAHAETKAAEIRYTHKSRILAQRLACHAGIEIETLNSQKLATWLANQFQSEEIDHIGVYDLQGKELALFNADANTTAAINLERDRVVEEPILGNRVSGNQPESGIYPQVIGSVRLLISTQTLNEIRREIVRHMALILIVGVVLLWLLNYLLDTLYCRPALELDSRIKRLLKGDFTSHNSFSALVELHHIGSSLDQLATQLNHQQINHALERQMQELRASGLKQALAESKEELAAVQVQVELERGARQVFVAEVERELRPYLVQLNQSAACIEGVDERAENLISVFDDLLVEWRRDPLELEIKSSVFDPRHCLESLIGLLVPGLPHISLILCLSPDTPRRVFADSIRLTQILSRWIDQLGKLMHSGHLLIRVRSSVLAGERGLLLQVYAPVTDLPASILQRMSFLFCPGTVLYTVAQGMRKTTTIESVVKVMKGKYGVISHPGGGVCCYLNLPVGMEQTHQDQSLPLAGISICLIDNIPLSRKALTWQLQTLGAEVKAYETIESLRQGNDMVHDQKFVIFNVQNYLCMSSPLRDFRNFCLDFSATPVLILPYGDLEGRDYYRKEGVNCLNQPVRSEDFIAMIKFNKEGQEQAMQSIKSVLDDTLDDTSSTLDKDSEQSISEESLLVGEFCDALLSSTRNNKSLAANLIRKLLEELPVQYQGIVGAFAAGNLQEAKDITHKINGSASFCRLVRMRAAADNLESALIAALESGQSGHDIANDKLIAILNQEINRLLAVGQQVLQALG